MPRTSGRLDEPAKSAYAFEIFHSGWEKQYMEALEGDPLIRKWTKRHGIEIPYVDARGATRRYRPDYLVELQDGKRELREVKGNHLLPLPDTQAKIKAAQVWCQARGLAFRVILKD